MHKNLALRMGNCPHRKYIPHLLELVANGTVDPLKMWTKEIPIAGAIEAFKAFDQRQSGWIKVELNPQAAA